MTEIQDKLYRLLVENLDLDESELDGVDENSLLFASDAKRHRDEGEEVGPDFGLDSIDALEITVLIEKEWNLDPISPTDMANFISLKSIEEYIVEHAKL